jgi:hypothetical protein
MGGQHALSDPPPEVEAGVELVDVEPLVGRALVGELEGPGGMGAYRRSGRRAVLVQLRLLGVRDLAG